MNTGFIAPACFSAWTIRPGIDPMYVRRCPRISASSRTPPSEMRTNSRPIARAIERPSDVLPTPGGPTKQRIGPRESPRSLRTPRNSRMRSLMSRRCAWSSSRICEAPARSMRSGDERDHPVEIGAHHVRLGAVRVHALEPAELALRLGHRLLGPARLFDLRAVLV